MGQTPLTLLHSAGAAALILIAFVVLYAFIGWAYDLVSDLPPQVTLCLIVLPIFFCLITYSIYFCTNYDESKRPSRPSQTEPVPLATGSST